MAIDTKEAADVVATDLTNPSIDVPLVVDVDALTKTDMLHEAALQFVARFPFQAWRIPLWLSRGGKSFLRTKLSEFGDPGVATTMPLREEIMALIKSAQDSGRRVYLVSDSEEILVETLARRIGGITGVFRMDRTANLPSQTRADRLVNEFGTRGFDYLGDQSVDMPAWQASRKVLVVSRSLTFERRVMKCFPLAQVVVRPRVQFREILRALRPLQWAKNTLVFVALIAGHHFQPHVIIATLVAFACFSMAASSAYLINDLLDLSADREHPRKRERPFASGEIPLNHGIIWAAALGGGSFALSLALPLRFSEILLLYVATALTYSFLFKRKLILDVVVLGGLYTLRVLGGLTLVTLDPTPWLLMFSLFWFSSLAIVKRCSELTAKRSAEKEIWLPGRSYQIDDLHVLFPLGAAAGYGSVFVFALYVSSPEVRALYTHPSGLWLVCPLLIYWISRIFLLANRNELHDDPVVFAFTDQISLLTGLCILIVLLVSL